MRTDAIAPRVALPPADGIQRKKWRLFNPAFGALLGAFVAGLFAESAFQAYRAGTGFDVWTRTLTAAFWFGMAIAGVVRGLREAQQERPQ